MFNKNILFDFLMILPTIILDKELETFAIDSFFRELRILDLTYGFINENQNYYR